MHFHEELDTSGLSCPQVLLEARKKLDTMKVGEVLKIISTDPSSELDFKVFAATKSYALLKYMKHEQKFIFWMKK